MALLSVQGKPCANGVNPAYVRSVLLSAVAGVVCICAICVIGSRGITNLDTNELYTDSMDVASKLVSAQKFTQATREERIKVVKALLMNANREHHTDKQIVSKVADNVANTHLSYHKRMEAMERLLNEQTHDDKKRLIAVANGPTHAGKKLKERGRAVATPKGAKHAKLAAHNKLLMKKAPSHRPAAAKQPSSAPTKSQKLIKWAEKHGMPKQLANNPKDKQKVKDIIARMKADFLIQKIQAQFKHDDASVGNIIKSADPAASTKGF